jgi:hypothetical protein
VLSLAIGCSNINADVEVKKTQLSRIVYRKNEEFKKAESAVLQHTAENQPQGLMDPDPASDRAGAHIDATQTHLASHSGFRKKSLCGNPANLALADKEVYLAARTPRKIVWHLHLRLK